MAEKNSPEEINQEEVQAHPEEEVPRVTWERVLAFLTIAGLLYLFAFEPLLLWLLRRQGYMVFWYAWEEEQLEENWAREADLDVLDARASYIRLNDQAI